MRKILLSSLIITLLLSVVGCSSNDEENKLTIDKTITDLEIIVSEIGESSVGENVLNYKSDIQEIQKDIISIKGFKDKEYNDKLNIINYVIDSGLEWFNNDKNSNFLYTDGLLKAINNDKTIINQEVTIESNGGKYMPITNLGQVDFNTYKFYGDVDFLSSKDGDTFTIEYGYYSGGNNIIDVLEISK